MIRRRLTKCRKDERAEIMTLLRKIRKKMPVLCKALQIATECCSNWGVVGHAIEGADVELLKSR